MSGFSSIALPGRIPSAGSGRGIKPEDLFANKEEKSFYQRLLDQRNSNSENIGFKKVKVEIFDLSDPKQVAKYEKLWISLLNKIAKMEVVVDSRQDLVHRADGTSYWMKYVEYVEFGDPEEDQKKGGKSKGENGK